MTLYTASPDGKLPTISVPFNLPSREKQDNNLIPSCRMLVDSGASHYRTICNRLAPVRDYFASWHQWVGGSLRSAAADRRRRVGSRSTEPERGPERRSRSAPDRCPRPARAIPAIIAPTRAIPYRSPRMTRRISASTPVVKVRVTKASSAPRFDASCILANASTLP